MTTDGSSLFTSHRLILIVLFALILRIAFPIFLLDLAGDKRVFYDDDTIEYIEPARSLLLSGQYAVKGVAEIVRTPGYSLLFIPGLILNSIEVTVIALQILISCFTIVIVYGIASLLYEDENVALLCAFLYAIEPLSIMYSSFLYSETLYACILMLSVYFIICYFKNGHVLNIIYSAAAIGISAYVRPISYYLPGLVLFSLGFWIIVRKTASQITLIRLFLFFLVAMAIIVPWQIRNGLETGYYGFSSISGQNLYFLIGGGILARKQGTTIEQQHERMGYLDPQKYFALHPEQKTWKQKKIIQYRINEGVNFLFDNLLIYLHLVPDKIYETLHETGIGGVVQITGVNKSSPRVRAIVFVLKVLFLILILSYWFLAIVGIVYRKWRYESAVILLLVIAAYLIVAPALCNVGYSRFRHPVMPIICLFAGSGLWFVFTQRKRLLSGINLSPNE